MIDALTMDDYPLSLTTLVERVQLFTDADVVTRRPDGRIVRSHLGECARRARHLATALAGLGAGPGDLVATLLWNQAEHLELYFAVPAMGATLHTLNPRLHPDELAFIANDACDSILVVDESLLDVASSVIKNHSFKNVIVVTSGQPIPDGMIGYESCIATTEPMGWPTIDERSPRSDVLHLRHDRASQRRRLLAPRPGPPLDGRSAARRHRDLAARHCSTCGSVVSRKRMGLAVCGRTRWCVDHSARSSARPRECSRLAGDRAGYRDARAFPQCGWQCWPLSMRNRIGGIYHDSSG